MEYIYLGRNVYLEKIKYVGRVKNKKFLHYMDWENISPQDKLGNLSRFKP